MSNDYISREAAKDAAALIALTSAKREMTCGEVKRIMENIPPANVQPVKHGEWMMIVVSIFNGECFVEWVCSECWYVHNRGWRHTNDGKCPGAKFCENCGADMRPEGGADG